jgi:hypothetical protein
MNVNARETASERLIRMAAEDIAHEELRRQEAKDRFMRNDMKRFEDLELLTAGSAVDLGKLVRERVLAGWDIFGGLHCEGGTWAQYVVRYLPKRPADVS